MSKPIVHYEISKDNLIKEGIGALIAPIDHPSDNVSNTVIAHTSNVLHYNEAANTFETNNTIYIGVDYEQANRRRNSVGTA